MAEIIGKSVRYGTVMQGESFSDTNLSLSQYLVYTFSNFRLTLYHIYWSTICFLSETQ